MDRSPKPIAQELPPLESGGDARSEDIQNDKIQVDLDSATLRRLLAEVRNEEAFDPTSYNRQHNRHNRTR